MRPTADLPHDPRLPGLMAIRDSGLARAIPALGLPQEGGGVELVLCGYHPGARATLDARVGQRRFAVKTFADDPAPEAALYNRKSTRLNSSHGYISYAVFCLKKKKQSSLRHYNRPVGNTSSPAYAFHAALRPTYR